MCYTDIVFRDRFQRSFSEIACLEDAIATLQDVAVLAGVSNSTVSRVLNNHPYVTEETKAKVGKAMSELNYRPSRVAQQLRTRESQILGFIVSDISNPFFSSVARGIEDVAHAKGYSVLLCNSDEDSDREKQYVDVLLAERIAGAIVVPACETSGIYKTFSEVGVPILALDRVLREANVDTVLVDNVKGAYQATTHLLRLGHRRIGLISGPLRVTTGRERQEGYKKAMSAHGLICEGELIKETDFTTDGGYQATLELLEMEDPPTAIFAANNLMTLGALSAIHEQSLQVPHDVAVVGFDDTPWASSLHPPLTVVAQPTYELGRTAADVLLKRISEGDREIVELRLEPTLVVRGSCGETRETARVRRAL